MQLSLKTTTPARAAACGPGAARLACRARVQQAAARVDAVAVAAARAATTDAPDFFASDKRPVILFDGVCNMCNGGVNFVLDYDKEGVYRMAALQSGPGRQLLVRCGRSPDDISSIVLVEEHAHFIKSEAVLRIATRLGMPLPLVALALGAVPTFIRDPVYDQVAANRYNVFGRAATCRVTSEDFASRFLGA